MSIFYTFMIKWATVLWQVKDHRESQQHQQEQRLDYLLYRFYHSHVPSPSIVRKEESGDHAYDKLFWWQKLVVSNQIKDLEFTAKQLALQPTEY